ncbi:GlxA family transcriptional regulator [Sorangium sp. So ce1153]|uniref:GlxA family transcriptional regulator n=1 Tax=Sorangium sp. So ce1153 TaxID=3133333 RepID=UPI003F64870E
MTRRIVVVAYDGASAIDVVGPVDVFACASQLANPTRPDAPPAYAVEIAAVSGGVIRTISGTQIVANKALEDVAPGPDTVLVAGGDTGEAMRDARLLGWLRAAMPEVRRMGAVCTGAFLLAAAGLLAGHRAATHWSAADTLARQFPAVEVDPDAIFVRSGKIYTSAGTTASIDLALSLVEEDLGYDVALEVARGMVVFLKRPGGQSQFSRPLLAQTAATGPLRRVIEWALRHLDADLRVEVLADKAGMSPRNFARTFARALQTTPAKFVEAARLEQARSCLEGGRASIKQLARDCGFGTDERMRRAFQRTLQVTPEEYRQRFGRS